MLPLARRAIKPIKCAGSRLILENVSSQCPHPHGMMIGSWEGICVLLRGSGRLSLDPSTDPETGR
jgi:hypothetical protein